MKFKQWVVALAVLFCAIPGPAEATPQGEARRDGAALQELVLKDGSRLYGVVLSEAGDEIVFRTQAGVEVPVHRADVATLRPVTGVLVEGEFWPDDPNAMRLFFAPTGRALAKGQASVGVYEFLMPFVQVGVTDRFSIGGGTPLVFGLGEGSRRPFWITPKLQVYDGERAQVAVGTMHIFTGGDGGGGIAYAVGTTGGSAASVTVGAGVTYSGSRYGMGLVMVGGERRVTRSVKVITENYLSGRGEGIVSGGFRFSGERLSADVGLAFPVGFDIFYAFPVVNFVYVF